MPLVKSSVSANSLTALNKIIVACEKCPRLVAYREQVARDKKRMYRGEEYWGKPVPGWGDENARVYIVGLAPAAHGGNRTGRVFTGERPGFLDTSDDHEELVVRPKDVQDNATPSCSAMTTNVFFKFGGVYSGGKVCRGGRSGGGTVTSHAGTSADGIRVVVTYHHAYCFGSALCVMMRHIRVGI